MRVIRAFVRVSRFSVGFFCARDSGSGARESVFGRIFSVRVRPFPVAVFCARDSGFCAREAVFAQIFLCS